MKTKQKKCLICGKRKTKFTTLPNKQDACIMCALTIIATDYANLQAKYLDLYDKHVRETSELIDMVKSARSGVTND